MFSLLSSVFHNSFIVRNSSGGKLRRQKNIEVSTNINYEPPVFLVFYCSRISLFVIIRVFYYLLLFARIVNITNFKSVYADQFQ